MGAPVVLAHGFTQNAHCWGPLIDQLADAHTVEAVDLPGHGEADALRADLTGAADLLVATGGRAAYLGYSLGGRIALHAALRHPNEVSRLVLISTTAGIKAADERADRRTADEALARTTDPLDHFLDRWTQLPLLAGIPAEALFLEERRRNSAAGLASSLRLCGTGTQEPLWSKLGDLTMPVLLISGGEDQKFTALAARMAEAIGAGARHVVVADAGHAPHLQRPCEVGTQVLAFLDDGH